MMPTDDEILLNRALASWFRHAQGRVCRPSDSSYVTTHDGKLYVVLLSLGGVLAVYRLLTSGALKRLKRWPKEVVLL